MKKWNWKTLLPPPMLVALLFASCSLIQEMPKDFVETYGNIAYVEKVEYVGLAENAENGDKPKVTETQNFKIIYSIRNDGNFDLSPEFSFEGCEIKNPHVETEKKRVALTVPGESLKSLKDGAEFKVKLTLYKASQKILQSAYDIGMRYVYTGDDDKKPLEPPEPTEEIVEENTVYVRGSNATWYASNAPTAENGSDDNSGDILHPFATIQKAVEKVIAQNDGTSPYTIYIDGTLKYDDEYKYAGAHGMADFSALKENLTLTIKALSETTKATLDANKKSRAIYAKSSNSVDLKLKMKNLVVKNGTTPASGYYGGGIYVENSKLEMEDCMVSGNYASHDGGAIYITGSDVTISGTTISGNKAKTKGGGVCVFSSSTFTMKSGTISDNGLEEGTNAYGGNVYVASSFIMGNGTISGGKAYKGGGVCVEGNNATFKMENGTISGNIAEQDGGGVYVKGGTFTMENGTINGENKNTAKFGGGVYIANGGTFIMKDGEISGNEVKGDDFSGGGGVNVFGGTFEMNGGTISGNKADSKDFGGGGVYVHIGQTFTMTGGTITGNKAANDGGGVYTQSGTFTMSGGTISANEANDGGGVYVNGGTFTMKNGTLSGNIASGNGGAAYVNGSTFTMEDGTLDANEALWAGGVYVNNNGTFKMTGGKISNNNAKKTNAQYSGQGGGVYVKNANFEISNSAEISNNTAELDGGGIYVYTNVANATLTMSGNSIISGNKAKGTDGGGVYNQGGDFTMSGGTISTNHANVKGGGIRSVGGTFEMSGGTISKNTADGDGKGVCVNNVSFKMRGAAKIESNNDVYLSDREIQIVGALMDSTTPVATITLPTDGGYAEKKTVLNVDNSVTETLDSICKKFAVTPQANGTKWKVVPSDDNNKWNGVLEKDTVSTGGGISVTITDLGTYIFVVKYNDTVLIDEGFELQSGHSIVLSEVSKDGNALNASDGTFTIEIQNNGSTWGTCKDTKFQPRVTVPPVPSKMSAQIYVKVVLVSGSDIHGLIPVTIVP